MSSSAVGQSRFLVLVLASFLILGLVYDAVTPILEVGDERFHFAYVNHLANGRGLPVQDPEHVGAWSYEGSQAPLYYVLAALATFWIDTSDFDQRYKLNPHSIVGIPEYGSNDNRSMLVHTASEGFPYQGTVLAVHLIRWLSLCMGAATILAAYHLAYQITGHQTSAMLAAVFIAFNPMFLYISAAVNNDSLVILLATLSLLWTTDLWQRGPTPRRVVTLGIFVGLAALSKLSALGLIGIAGLVVLIATVREAGRLSRPITLNLSLYSVTVVLVAGWWYARNIALYGDFTGLNRLLDSAGTRQGAPQALPLLQAEAEGLWLSFWGLFGGVNVLAASWVYVVFGVLTALALVGIVRLGVESALASFWLPVVRRWFRQGTGLSTEPYPTGSGGWNLVPWTTGFMWLVLWLLLLFIAWLRLTLLLPATQARLLFPAISVMSIGMAVGLVALTPQRLIRPVIVIGGSLMFLIALRVAVVDIASAYTPSPLVDRVPEAAAVDPIRFEDALELVGAEMPGSGVRPGESVRVVLYWKAIAPMTRDYSAFVHLLDEGDLIVAQRDTYPGLGLRPTSQLRAGDIVRDVYRMDVDPSALAPSQPQVRVGVYESGSGQRLNASVGSQAVGDNPVVGVVNLKAHEKADAPNPIRFTFDQNFSLAGYEIEPVVVHAGTALTLTLVWQANGRVPNDYAVFSHVLGQSDSLWGQVDRQLPMAGWQKGQLISDVHVIQVKPETPTGVYWLEVGAYNLDDNLKRLTVWSAAGQLVGDRVLLRKIRVWGK